MLTTLYRKFSDHEACFYIESDSPLTPEEHGELLWIVRETYEPDATFTSPFITSVPVVEIGPRPAIESPFSSNAVSIARAIGLTKVSRIERSLRYPITAEQTEEHTLCLHFDPMTQQVYENRLTESDLVTHTKPEPVRIIPILEQGVEATKRFNLAYGLGMDDWDVEHWTNCFIQLGRNPTDVELFQIGNANSDHSRHWLFKGKIFIEGVLMPYTLFDLIRAPLKALGTTHNSILAFNDNAGAIQGSEIVAFVPSEPGKPSPYILKTGLWHHAATAETHNFPTMIAPFPGAETGTGGRIRDNSAAGRGSLPGVAVCGYITGNLHLPDYAIPGETIGGEKTLPFASPAQILIEASNGCTSYGNKYGEPVIAGFTRTFGLIVNGERREALKPVLYSGGIGQIFDVHIAKRKPEQGMLIIRIGGPAYRIGVGGGGASSMIGGTNSTERDYKAVQRGNPEVGNRTNRVIRTCVEKGDQNPIESIHDQGAGGPSNVLTELMEPVGGRVDIRKIILGDTTMSVLEIWSAEYQEGYGLLMRPERLEEFQAICRRERVNCEVLGEITGDGRVVVVDSKEGTTPVDLKLDDILGKLPQKSFYFERTIRALDPLVLLEKMNLGDTLEKLFRLPEVGSKAYLTNKGDRSVTGLVVQQQCCGPHQLPVADVGVKANGYFDRTGVALALGEAMTKILVDAKAGARMSVGEMLTNICAAGITRFGDIKCRVNEMWAAKTKEEGAFHYDAVHAVSELLQKLRIEHDGQINGVAADGGKDSSSMAVKLPHGEIVKSPGEIVILGYAPVPDIGKVVTPDFKPERGTKIGFIDIGQGKDRLGGSSLAHAYGQIGNEVPDVDDAELLIRAFEVMQTMIGLGQILAYHDRSDGGLATTLAEMCMAGNCGAEVTFDSGVDLTSRLFSEELGMVFQYRERDEYAIRSYLHMRHVPFTILGEVTPKDQYLRVRHGMRNQHIGLMLLRRWWEATSLRLDELQANRQTVDAERRSMNCNEREYNLTFTPVSTPEDHFLDEDRPHVAVIREEGTNGDMELAAACHAAGMKTSIINMQDLLDGTIALDSFQMILTAGGFSYMDVFGSGKGWAATILFNERLTKMFEEFRTRSDTLSLHICNGCQWSALLGWLPFKGADSLPVTKQPRFIHNDSGRFESRWIQIRVNESPSVFFEDMWGSSFGVWVAHGEGKLYFPDPELIEAVEEYKLVPISYTDEKGEPTVDYPANPNGSYAGYAGLCTPDGRHTAMMPHPERCFRKETWGWMPEDLKCSLSSSPWLTMFQNARKWLMEHKAR
jgi:phosphoribosylformylglycinamidine synthase